MSRNLIMKMFCCILLLCLISMPCYAGGPVPQTDLNTAITLAGKEGKMLFVEYGREECGNCQHLKKLIRTGKLELPENEFIYVDLDCDNSQSKAQFKSRYDVNGNTLPFVVIADSDGKMIVQRTGYGELHEYKELVRKAKIKNKSLPDDTDNKSISNSQTSKTKVKTLDDIRRELGK